MRSGTYFEDWWQWIYIIVIQQHWSLLSMKSFLVELYKKIKDGIKYNWLKNDKLTQTHTHHTRNRHTQHRGHDDGIKWKHFPSSCHNCSMKFFFNKTCLICGHHCECWWPGTVRCQAISIHSDDLICISYNTNTSRVTFSLKNKTEITYQTVTWKGLNWTEWTHLNFLIISWEHYFMGY